MKRIILKWINKKILQRSLKILQRSLKKGYEAKAKLNLKICEDFKFVDGESML